MHSSSTLGTSQSAPASLTRKCSFRDHRPSDQRVKISAKAIEAASKSSTSTYNKLSPAKDLLTTLQAFVIDGNLAGLIAMHKDLTSYFDALVKVTYQNTDSTKQHTALNLSLKYGHVEIVHYLIEHGADVDQKSDGKSPFYYAIDTAHKSPRIAVHCLDILVENKANLSILYEDGVSLFDRGMEIAPEIIQASVFTNLSL